MAREESRTSVLKQVPLFAGLDDETLRLLEASCRQRTFASGVALFHEGDPGHTLYIILSGYVNIEKLTSEGRTVHLARRGPGEHVGEMALLDDQPRSASAVSHDTSPCTLLTLQRQEFLRCLELSPTIALNIIRSLILRLRESGEHALRHETLDVMGRLAIFLLEEAETQGAPDPAGGVRLAKISEQALAERIGTTRESVSRKLSRLAEVGAIWRDGRAIIVRNKAKLRNLCGQ